MQSFNQVYLCSDYHVLAEDMRSHFLASGIFKPAVRTAATVVLVDQRIEALATDEPVAEERIAEGAAARP